MNAFATDDVQSPAGDAEAVLAAAAAESPKSARAIVRHLFGCLAEERQRAAELRELVHLLARDGGQA